MNENIRQLLKIKPMTVNKLAHIIASKTGQRKTVVIELFLKELRNSAIEFSCYLLAKWALPVAKHEPP